MQKNRKNTRRKGNRQKAWQYMRRNPMFAVNDILLILDMSEHSLMLFIRQLHHAGYVRQISGGKVFKKRCYKLLKNTGVLCPQWIGKQGKLFDPNIKEFKPRDVSVPLPVLDKSTSNMKPIDPLAYAKGRIVQILDAEENGLGVLKLSERSGVSGNRFSRALSALVKEGKAEHIGYAQGVPLYRKVCDDKC